MKSLETYRFECPIGTLYLSATDTELCGVHWKRQTDKVRTVLTGRQPAVLLLSRTVRQLEEYFSGRRRSFDLPMNSPGTPFQLRVWNELGKIPYGETISYRELARRVRSPFAFRAVGTANGKNPMSILVPCHRVIASDGTLGGYAGGLPIKTKLLEIERNSSG